MQAKIKRPAGARACDPGSDRRGEGEPVAAQREAVEVQHSRFGKGKFRFMRLPEAGWGAGEGTKASGGFAVLHRMALRPLRSRHHAAFAGFVLLQSSARGVPDLPRLRPDHRDRSASGDSRPAPERGARRRTPFPDRERPAMPERSDEGGPSAGARCDLVPSRRPFQGRPGLGALWRAPRRERRGAVEGGACGMACRAFSTGSNRRPTKCTCASCSAATALTRRAQIAAAGAINPRR